MPEVSKVPKRLLDLYGNADAADEAMVFFHRGPGRAVVALLQGHIEKLVDVRYGDSARDRMSPTDRAIVIEARLQAARVLESVVGILTSKREATEGGGDEQTTE